MVVHSFMYCSHKLGIRLASIAPSCYSLQALTQLKLPRTADNRKLGGGLGTRLHLLPVLERYSGFTTVFKVSFTVIRELYAIQVY